MKTYKTKLKLNNKQKFKLHANASVARFAYNLTLQIQEENYKRGNKFLSDCAIRKLITVRKQNKEDLYWLYKYDCDIVKQAVKDACNAYKKFFKKISGKPRFKSKKFSKQSFYVDTYKIKVALNKVQIPIVGKLCLYEKNYIPQGVKYYNPRIIFDGVDWFISVGVEEQPKSILTEEIVGIDLGLKELATCSNNMTFHNITKSEAYEKIQKSKKQKQRQISRKYLLNKQGNKFIETNNIKKIKVKIQKKQIKLNNMKLDYFHKSTTALVRTKPKAIVVEDLNVAGMIKNKHLSKSFQETSISTWRSLLTNKCIRDNIEVIEADRFYPSSKLCSYCGFYKKDLKLSDRIYKCPKCGLEIDRDYNASLNLQKYPQFEGNLSLWRTKKTLVA